MDVTNPFNAQDSMKILDRSLEKISLTRNEIRVLQKNNLGSRLKYLRITHENVISSESIIRDVNTAEAMIKFTRDQIIVKSSTVMLAQSVTRAESALQLIT